MKLDAGLEVELACGLRRASSRFESHCSGGQVGQRVRRKRQSQDSPPLLVGAQDGGADLRILRHVPELIVLVGRRGRQIEDVNGPLLRNRVPDNLSVGLRSFGADHRYDPCLGGDYVVDLPPPQGHLFREIVALAGNIVALAGEIGVLFEQIAGGKGQQRRGGDQQQSRGPRFGAARLNERQDLLLGPSGQLFRSRFFDVDHDRSLLSFFGDPIEQSFSNVIRRGLKWQGLRQQGGHIAPPGDDSLLLRSGSLQRRFDFLRRFLIKRADYIQRRYFFYLIPFHITHSKPKNPASFLVRENSDESGKSTKSACANRSKTAPMMPRRS